VLISFDPIKAVNILAVNTNCIPPLLHTDGETLILELKDLYTRYTNDVIARAAFGIDLDSLKHPTNEFYMMAQRAVQIASATAVKSTGCLISPKLTQVRCQILELSSSIKQGEFLD
jgi:cytochrome P450 family 9